MAGYNLANLQTDIRNYTEVDSGVFTDAILNRFIENAEFRIYSELPMDSGRYVSEGTLAANDNTINVPGKGTKGATGTLFVRGVEVFNSTTNSEGNGTWLEKKDQTYLSEYVDRKFGPSGEIQSPTDTANSVTGFPKYYAMFGGATGDSSTTSGGMYIAPTPDANYIFRIYYNMVPLGLESETSGTYISKYFPQGLLYACLVEAYGYLKGPIEMLTLYENKYKNAIQQFAGMQIGRRRRDDYTDGTVRIPVKSPSP
jgi:hypothetical protein|tara:strand:+ start:1662 stop:2429 length:768 start_codon:yes stop_codon:yes gene_type:complete